MDCENTVLRTLALIESRIEEKLTVENLADSAYFSKYHYQRKFREIVGDSVMDYVRKRKLTLAGSELRETSANVLDIALKYGYDSHEGFTRAFKAYTGLSPSEYRKTGHTPQKAEKERMKMTDTSSGIIRDLNAFISEAKKTADDARKCALPQYAPFWNTIAKRTDALAEKLKTALERETADRLYIIKIAEDTAFEASLLAFNAGLTVSRGQPEDAQSLQPLCDKYTELASRARLKSESAVRLFSELTEKIFAEMRKTAAERVQAVTEAGKTAAEKLVDYPYIRDEVRSIINGLSEMPELAELEDALFRLHIVKFAADTDTYRNPDKRAQFSGLTVFATCLEDATAFFKTLPNDCGTPGRAEEKCFRDIAFQTNIFLFYTKGETEKLGKLLNAEQKAAFEKILKRISETISLAQSQSEYSAIAGNLRGIQAALTAEAVKLEKRGGAVSFLAEQFGNLAESVAKPA
jgi:AraC family transcriptional regulator